ncbi:hypothetical protein BOTBODRAFT_164471 [Botryobasidium botryosum FD-172 SS1]|uniref:Delta 8-(E)-sphingolipid desaturase n=1 Tax=Botryobasidium botryosum (strain FD-172 SS1) TaxID=930990 RepID=A0A067MD28_BOTB1|nr:hypothetical protein BOTBODRAFT_164471 [Botryobasidium botryosum FD-172 SS1]
MHPGARSERVWSRDQVAGRILKGDALIIYNGLLLHVPPSWLVAHPGGSLAILHFVGRDATDEIGAYHPPAVIRSIEKYAIGRVECGKDGWESLVPPVMRGWVRRLDRSGEMVWAREADVLTTSAEPALRSEILLVKKDWLPSDKTSSPTISELMPPPTALSLSAQNQHARAYRDLHARVKAAGLYKTPYLTGYGPEILRYILFGAISALAYRHGWLITSAVSLGFLWHQLTFTAHDLGHCGVTHVWWIDRLLGILIADFIGGLSIGWWVDNHNVHHLVTNHPSHDPDIQHIPFFAIAPAFLTSLWSSYYKRVMKLDGPAAFFLSMQHKLFYVVMSLARFNLYANSYAFLWKRASNPKKGWSWWLEVAGMAFYWTWYIAVLRGCGTWRKAIAYMLVSHVVTSPLHVQIVLSHFSRSTEDLGVTESFPDRQLRTTTDVHCHPHLAFIHGGLHLQVTHHLFPRLPRHNLKAASALVKEFAKEQGLEYAEFGFWEGNEEVLGVLRGVAEQVKIMGKVAHAEAMAMADAKVGAKVM